MTVNRFVETQKMYIDVVKDDLTSGKKKNHWIWFIFPQLKGLGKSQVSQYFGIKDMDEAREYYKEPTLKKNLDDCFKIVLKYKDYNALSDCFGTLDTKKVHSCATLFYLSTKKPIFKKFLDKFFNGLLDEQTVILLS